MTTELMVSRGDTFPRSFFDGCRIQHHHHHRPRSTTSEQLYNELKASKSDEMVLQSNVTNNTTATMPTVTTPEMHRGHSEQLLDVMGDVTPPSSPGDSGYTLPSRRRIAGCDRDRDRVDPEDSIRDMVSENDFYRFVLFKKHYEKYLHLSQKYEEVRNIAYYLEEKYHEVKMQRDELIYANEQLTKRIVESNEIALREKEDEVFLQLEKVVHLEEQCEKLRAEKEKCQQQKELIEKEKNEAYRLLKIQAQESEANRRTLEKSRQDVIRQMTAINTEKEWLERENEQLKETLETERLGMSKYLSQLANQKKRSKVNVQNLEKEMDELKLVANQNAALSSQFQKAMKHLATCNRKKCSVCAYTKAAFGNFTRHHHHHHHRHDSKLFSCFQLPFQDLRNKMKLSPTSNSEENESLSEFFRPSCTTTSECSSLSIPFGELAISYMDDCSSLSSTLTQHLDLASGVEEAGGGRGTSHGFGGSDSGFSSDLCTDCKSLRNKSATPKEKFVPKATLDESDCVKLQRTKWTASFRKLINKVAMK